VDHGEPPVLACTPLPPSFGHRLEVVDAQSRRMGRLLTDLRKLAELEAAPLALEDVDLAETVQDAVNAVVEEAAGRGAALGPFSSRSRCVSWRRGHGLR